MLERGEPERALAEAERIGKGAEPEIELEAIVVQAAALDALGKKDDAIARLDRIDVTTLDDLARLGQPRVRPLAKAAAERARS